MPHIETELNQLEVLFGAKIEQMSPFDEGLPNDPLAIKVVIPLTDGRVPEGALQILDGFSTPRGYTYSVRVENSVGGGSHYAHDFLHDNGKAQTESMGATLREFWRQNYEVGENGDVPSELQWLRDIGINLVSVEIIRYHINWDFELPHQVN